MSRLDKGPDWTSTRPRSHPSTPPSRPECGCPILLHWQQERHEGCASQRAQRPSCGGISACALGERLRACVCVVGRRGRAAGGEVEDAGRGARNALPMDNPGGRCVRLRPRVSLRCTTLHGARMRVVLLGAGVQVYSARNGIIEMILYQPAVPLILWCASRPPPLQAARPSLLSPHTGRPDAEAEREIRKNRVNMCCCWSVAGLSPGEQPWCNGHT